VARRAATQRLDALGIEAAGWRVAFRSVLEADRVSPAEPQRR
jgi:hypothetical protein